MKLIFTVLIVSVLTGCLSNGGGFSFSGSSEDDAEKVFQKGAFVSQVDNSIDSDLGAYTRQIIADMKMNMRAVKPTGIIAVTNFGNASSNYEEIGELGFALGESFLRELHQAGFNTLDYKVSDAIRVTPQGDFVLSRDFMELKNQVEADYVLVGTLTEQQKGIVVNARIVDLTSKAIMATGKSFIPRSKVDTLVAYRLPTNL